MDRTEFLKLCQQVSTYPERFGIRQKIPSELIVICDGISYYPKAYEIAFDKGNAKHRAILHALNTNSITYCDLKKVEKKER